ncbi:MAG: branched-chain amino acid ABC transporter permease [Deltaproteobacteria bacterium]|nr:branched-chain amino acid ABC transporter permease [Deltaproteobacteria bacterium]
MTTPAQLWQFLLSGLTTGSIYALIAIGFSVIHNATGIVNFAQGEFVMLGAMTMITFSRNLGLPMPAAFAASVLAVAAIGIGLERGPLRNARSRVVLILVMITVGASIFIRGVSMIIWGKMPLSLPPFSGDTPICFLSAAVMPQSLWIFGITLCAVIILHYFFKHTMLGKAMRAVAANRRAARLSGISVDRIVFFSFALSSALGGMAGIIITPITTMSYDAGVMLGLKGFSAAVLGGYGSMAGAIIGGLTLGVLETAGAGLLSSHYKDAIAFLVLLFVLFFRPAGFFGMTKVQRL